MAHASDAITSDDNRLAWVTHAALLLVRLPGLLV